MSESSSIVRPEVVFIEDLLDQIDKGELLVPRFQRPFQWKPKQMTQLFDSIVRGYPIGSLLLWQTDRAVKCLESIGPLPLPSPAGRVSYVLDGHQRLSTLYGVLRLPKSFPRKPDNKWFWWVWYNLKTREFVQLRSDPPPAECLPMRSILKTMPFLSECRRINDALPKQAEVLIERAEVLAQRIKNYKLPIMIVEGDLDHAVETFSRLNSTGRSMSTDQMLSALTYSEGAADFHLDSRIDRMCESLSEYNFAGIGRTIVFRSIVAALEMDIYRTDWSKVSKKLTKDLPKVVTQCEEGMSRAARFLSRVIGVPSDKFLPYSLQLTLLTEYFRHRETVTDSHKALLKRWFWVTSFSGWFAGANDSQINNALAEFRQLALLEREDFSHVDLNEHARPFPSQFFLRSARVRSFALFIKSLKPRSLETGEQINRIALLRQDGSDAFVYVDDHQPSLPANRLLLGADHRRGVIDHLLKVDPTHLDVVLSSHGIPLDAFRALKRSKLPDFVRLRTEHLKKLERSFLKSKGVAPPENDLEGDPDTDADSASVADD